MLNHFVKSLFDGYAAAKTPYADKKKRDWEFKELETYPMLFSSEYLNTMYDKAETKSEHESILEHLYKFGKNTENVESYRKIEKKIIDKYRRD